MNRFCAATDFNGVFFAGCLPRQLRIRWLFLLLLLPSPAPAYGAVNSAFAQQCVLRYADHYGIPPEFIAALIDVESRWNSSAVSDKGAMGIMQLMPETARRYGAVHPFDVEENIAAGTRFVTALMWEFHGNLQLVAAAYYAGDGRVSSHHLSYVNADVLAYVEAVQQRYQIRKFRRERVGQ